MRTTLTLDPDVARLIAEEAQRQRRPFKQVVNDAIRRGLGGGTSPRRNAYRVRPHKTKLRPGFDKAGFNKLADELEDEAALLKRHESLRALVQDLIVQHGKPTRKDGAWAKRALARRRRR